MSSEDQNEIKEIKVILIGNSGVGKTNLIRIAVDKGFNELEESSLTTSFCRKKITFDNKEYVLNLWDTIGQENLRMMNRLFYKSAKIVIFVYDITNKQSFDDLKYWVNEVNNQIGDDNFVRGIIGNKMDLCENEEISLDDLDNFATSLNAKFMRISAKKNEKIKMINFLSKLVNEYLDTYDVTEIQGRITLTTDIKNKKKNKCCQ